MFRNIFWMTSSSALRVGAGFFLFILIARHLGADGFGQYMFWFGVAYLSAVLANYGLGNMLLREVAQAPEKVSDFLADALSARLMISVILVIFAFGAAAFVSHPGLLIVLLLAHLMDVLVDTFFVSYRAMGKYVYETQLATCSAVMQLSFVSVAIWLNLKAEGVAFFFLLAKIVLVVLVLLGSRQVLGRFVFRSIRVNCAFLARTGAYAFDNVLLNAFGNVDSVVLKLFSGFDVVGIYQSGMRLFMGGAQAGPILANVFVPEIVKAQKNDKNLHNIVIMMMSFFLSFALFFGLALAYCAEVVVDFALGHEFERVIDLLPLFGLLFFVRFFAAGWGTVLTALGYQAYRAKSTAVHLFVSLVIGGYLTYDMGSKGWLLALVLANILLYMLYMLRVLFFLKEGRIKAIGLVAFSLGCVSFIPVLFGNMVRV